MTDFFSSPSAQRLDRANAELAATLDGAQSAPHSSASSRQPSAVDDATLVKFEDAATHNVPVDVLLGMADHDSGFDPYARSRGHREPNWTAA